MSKRGAIRPILYKHGLIRNLERLARGLQRLPSNRPARRGLERLENVAYGPAPAHRLDVYRPLQMQGPLPTLIYIHGGGFQFFDKDTHWAIASRFAQEGMVVFTIDYHLAPEHLYPAAVKDAALAYEWVAQHAHEYGGDLSRLVLAGESAGGNLVAGLTISACCPREEPWAKQVWATDVVPKVLLPACGYLSVSDPGRHTAGGEFPRWMEERIFHVSDSYLPEHTPARPDLDYANPLLVLEQLQAASRPLPATFAFSGDKDPVYGDTVRLGEALKRLGVPCEARIYEGGIHTFHAAMSTQLAKKAWREQLSFMWGALEAAASQ